MRKMVTNGEREGSVRKKRKKGEKEEGREEPENVCDILIFIFVLNIQREYLISREQKSSIGEIENRARNKEVHLRSSTAEGIWEQGEDK